MSDENKKKVDYSDLSEGVSEFSEGIRGNRKRIESTLPDRETAPKKKN